MYLSSAISKYNTCFMFETWHHNVICACEFRLTLAWMIWVGRWIILCAFQMNLILSFTKIKLYCLCFNQKNLCLAVGPMVTMFTYIVRKISIKNNVRHWSVLVFTLLTLATSNCRTLLLTFSARVEVKETMLDSCLESVSKIWRLGLSKIKEKNINLNLWIICNKMEEITTD